jgi:hypothetical protein
VPINTIRITTRALIATAMGAAAIGLSATAQADPSYKFQSPSGNILCTMYTPVGGDRPLAYCEIANHTWAAPAQSSYGCPLAPSANQFSISQGETAVFACMTQHLAAGTEQILDYGQSRSVGLVTCASETSSVTCTDTGTGHFFRVSHDSYELG